MSLPAILESTHHLKNSPIIASSPASERLSFYTCSGRSRSSAHRLMWMPHFAGLITDNYFSRGSHALTATNYSLDLCPLITDITAHCSLTPLLHYHYSLLTVGKRLSLKQGCSGILGDRLKMIYPPVHKRSDLLDSRQLQQLIYRLTGLCIADVSNGVL